MREIIQRYAESTAEDFLGAVYAELYAFMGGAKSADDITLVIIKVDGNYLKDHLCKISRKTPGRPSIT